MAKKTPWAPPSKSFGKQNFFGFYTFGDRRKVRPWSRQRFFVLVGEKTGRRVELESHEVAKKLHWKKVRV